MTDRHAPAIFAARQQLPTSAERAALMKILGEGHAIEDAFTRAEAHCAKHGVGESWHKVENKVLTELRNRGVHDKVRYRGRWKLHDLIHLANKIIKRVQDAVDRSEDVDKVAADLAVRGRH